MAETEAPAPNPEDQKLLDSEEAYAQAYALYRNKAKAARAAGYSAHTARQIGYEMYNKPYIRRRINELLEQNSMGGEEAVRILSDMAEFNMTDYMRPIEVYEQPMVKMPLKQMVEQKREELRREKEYIKRKGATDADEKLHDAAHLKRLEREILRLEVDLDANPTEVRIVMGEPRLVKRMDLDLDKLVKDKERGRIKSIKHTKDGIQVEGYDAQVAAINIAKIGGKFEKDNAQKAPVINNNLALTKEQIKEIADNLDSEL